MLINLRMLTGTFRYGNGTVPAKWKTGFRDRSLFMAGGGGGAKREWVGKQHFMGGNGWVE